MDAIISFNPLISIVIPVYNGSNYLREAIDSALNQTYQNIEIIVVNDGSNDGGETEKIALSYGDKIRYFKKPNGGVASALNLAINEMRGEYFSWLSHDDVYPIEKILKQINLIKQKDCQQKIVYGDCIFINENGQYLSTYKAGDINQISIRYHLTVKTTIHGCSLLIPRCVFENVGCFNEGLRTTQDYEMWFRMAGSYEFIYLPSVVVKSRQHKSQDSYRFRNIIVNEGDVLKSTFISALNYKDFSPDASMFDSYIELSKIMRYFGYTRSSRMAACYASKHARLGNPLVIIRNYLLLSYNYLLFSYDFFRIQNECV